MMSNLVKEKIIKRDSNIELLRIIAMFMIIAHHFSIHGNFNMSSLLFINNIWLNFLYSGGKIGVNIFIMISGYYLILSSRIQTNKFLKLFFQILTYSICIFAIFVLFGLESFNNNDFINHIFGY